MITASTPEPSIASRKAAKSSSPYFVGRHMRGLWLKIWIDSQPSSLPRSTALSRPPDVETCAAISIDRHPRGALRATKVDRAELPDQGAHPVETCARAAQTRSIQGATDEELGLENG